MMVSLKEFYYNIEDRAWSLADSLEDKGLHISSFCDKHHISPLLLFLGIAALLIILIVLLFTVFGSVNYGYAMVTVQADNVGVSGVDLSYDFAGETKTAVTDNTGKAELELPIGVEVNIIAYKENYKGSTVPYTLEGEEAELTITISRRIGSLEVSVNPPEGEQLPSGSTVKLVGEGIIRFENVVNGVASFSDLPAGASVAITLRIPGVSEIDGGTVTIIEGTTESESINVPLTLLKVNLIVSVLDPNGAPVNTASVELFNSDTGASLGTAMTISQGQVNFEVPLGVRVYATVNPSGSFYSVYNGREDGNFVLVSGDDMTYRARLSTVGKVKVCVYDSVTSTPLSTGSITLKSSSGLSLGTQDVSAACTDFYGIPEGTRIYPEVVVTGYKRYSEPAQSKVVDYSTETRFDVSIQTLSSSDSATIYVTASDCEDDSCLRGIRIKLIEEYTNLVLDEGITTRDDSLGDITSGCCGIVAFTGIEKGMQVYATAFDEDYEFVVSSVIEAQDNAVIDLSLCESGDLENELGDLEVCVYKDGEPYDNSNLELYNSNGDLLWYDETDDEEGDDNCHIFQNLPDGMSVYAIATNLPGTPSSEDVTIIGGEVQSVSVYSGEEPDPELLRGDVNICLYDSLTSYPVTNANISIYDYETRQKIGSLDSDELGCVTFSEVEAQIVLEGIVTTRQVYIVTRKTGYATYNGIVESGIVEMLPGDTRAVTLYLDGHFPICVQVVKEETWEGVKAQVSLYYNDTEDAVPVNTIESGDNGTVIFYQSELPDYYFRVTENYTLLAPDPIYHFEKVYVTDGNCAALTLRDLPCTLALDVLLEEDSFEGAVDKDTELPIILKLNGERADTGIVSEGSSLRQHSVMTIDGSIANLTIKLDNVYQDFVLSYGYTDYSDDQELIATIEVPSDDGEYELKIEAEIEDGCSDQKILTLEAIEETLAITTDDISIDLEEDNFARFCVYVKDRKGEDIDDATVTVTLDPLDGWNSEYSRSATWNTVKDCYVGSFPSSVAPTKTGTYVLYITAEDGEISDTQQFDAKVQAPLTADELGTPLLTATSTKVLIGVNSGSICATFKERTGDEITDGAVALRLYPEEGWTGSAPSGQASYDFARKCYYMSVPMSVVPTDKEGTYAATVVGQTKDGRTASTIVSVMVECGCDEEDSCEPSCTCDPDCDDAKGAGAINLFGCLQLASGMGYSPQPYSYGSPYGQNYGQQFNPYSMYGQGMYGQQSSMYGTQSMYGQYPMSSGMYGSNYQQNPYMSSYGSTGGMNVGSGTIGIGGPDGYIGFNWEACKALLNKLGWGGSKGNVGGMNVRSTVQINDNKGVVETQQCAQITNAFKQTDGVTFAVVSGGKITCTNVGSTDYTNWRNLVTSTMNSGKFTLIDLEVFTDAVTFNSRYPNARVQLIQPSSGLPVAYDKSSNWILGSDAVFSFEVKSDTAGSSIFPTAQESQKVSNRLIWGAIKKENLASILSSGVSEMLSGNWVGYPSGVVNLLFVSQRPGSGGATAAPAAVTPVGGSASTGGKTIIISGGEEPSIAGASTFSASSLDKTTATKLKKVAPATTLIITANVNDLDSEGIREVISKPVSCGDYRFTEVNEDKITICKNGKEDKLGEEELYVLYDNKKKAYVVGEDVSCSGTTELSASTTGLSNVGLVCKGKGTQGTVWYLQSGSDEYLSDVVEAFTTEKKEGVVPAEDKKFFSPCEGDENDGWHSCKFDNDGARDINKENLARTAGTDENYFLDCICYGNPEERPKTVSGSVKIPEDAELVSGTATILSQTDDIGEDKTFEITGITGEGKETLEIGVTIKQKAVEWTCTASKEVDLSQGGDVGEIDVSGNCRFNAGEAAGAEAICEASVSVGTRSVTEFTDITGTATFTVDGKTAEATKNLETNVWTVKLAEKKTDKSYTIRATAADKTGAVSAGCDEGVLLYLTASTESLCTNDVRLMPKDEEGDFKTIISVKNEDGSKVIFKKEESVYLLSGALKGYLTVTDYAGENYIANVVNCDDVAISLVSVEFRRKTELRRLYSSVFDFEEKKGFAQDSFEISKKEYTISDIPEIKNKFLSLATPYYYVINSQDEVKKILDKVKITLISCTKVAGGSDKITIKGTIGNEEVIQTDKEYNVVSGERSWFRLGNGKISSDVEDLSVDLRFYLKSADFCDNDFADIGVFVSINYP
jgi:hypothetical protein